MSTVGTAYVTQGGTLIRPDELQRAIRKSMAEMPDSLSPTSSSAELSSRLLNANPVWSVYSSSNPYSYWPFRYLTDPNSHEVFWYDIHSQFSALRRRDLFGKHKPPVDYVANNHYWTYPYPYWARYRGYLYDYANPLINRTLCHNLLNKLPHYHREMSAYAIGPLVDQPMIRHNPVQLRARTLADLSRSFAVGDTSPSPNTPLSYKTRSWSWRTFHQSRLDDVFYPDDGFHFGTSYRTYPVLDKYHRRDHAAIPYTFWSRAYCNELYPTDRLEMYRRIHEPYRDEYSYKLWNAPRRALLKDVFQ
uniref:Uncharacterized protein n=1 Tax=Globodera rostochiensis TaxID=31243 RepID=A0A914GU79_GLORO